MVAVKEKKVFLPDYENFSNYFVEDNKKIILDFNKSFEKKIDLNRYESTTLPSDYKLIIDRLDEIENLIKTKVAHKEDIYKSKDDIILEQKKQLDDIKKYIARLLSVLDKKSTPRIFATISLFGLIISVSFLFLSIFLGEIILTNIHFIFSSIAFFLMFIMARLSKKLHYGKDS